MKLICSSRYNLNKNEKKKVSEILSNKKDNIYSKSKFGYHQNYHQKKQIINNQQDNFSEEKENDNFDDNEIDQDFENEWIQEKISLFVNLNTNFIEESNNCDNNLLRIIAECTLEIVENKLINDD